MSSSTAVNNIYNTFTITIMTSSIITSPVHFLHHTPLGFKHPLPP